jgi:hypothetical protein
MTLRCLEPLALKFDGRGVCLEPGACFTVTPDQAQRILAQFPGKVEVLDLPPDLPIEPLQPGWLVCYRDRAGRLCGGCDDRAHGTVTACQWDGSAWMVTLTDGQALPLGAVRSVAKTDASGRVLVAWTVREHGYSGLDSHERSER